MKYIKLLLTITIMLPILGFAQGYSVQSLQKINNDKGGLLGSPLANGDKFGYAVEDIGDVDKDGINDVAVGSPFDDDSITDQGAVYILMLNADGTVKNQQKISALAGNGPSFSAGHLWFGSGIAALGDLNGDGNVDIAVGGYGCGDDGVGTKNGAVYILFLSDSGTVLEYNKISDNEGGLTGILGSNDYFGTSVENIGDLNGDGLPDLAVGATSDDDGGTNRGCVYILNLDYNGRAKSYQKISDTYGGFTGVLDDSDNFGTGAIGLGDVDGDGVIDIAVGAIGDDDGGAGRGAVWICFMNTDGTVKSHQKISDTQGSFTGTLDDTDYFGQSLVNLGDLDGDGISDIGVGADRDDDGGTDQGALWILYLKADGTVKSHDKIGTDDPLLDPEVGGFDYFMCDVAFFGDRNNDGKIDLVAGAWNAKEGSTTSGEIYILHLEGLATYPNKQYYATPQFITANKKHSGASGEPLYNDVGAGDFYGSSTCGIRDIDGDGINDMVVGAIWSLKDGSSAKRGAVYVQLLNADGSIKSYQKITHNEGGLGTLSNYSAFGASVCSLGDLDNDGVTDIAVGSRLDDDGGTNRGAVWVLFLNTNGTVKTYQKISDTQGDFTGTLDDSDYFGASVASPGDIDGDGIQDLAVGAYADDDGGTNKGAIWVLFLDTDGTVKSEQKISDTDGNFTATIDVNDNIGYSLTSLGDLDGNGTPDICTGAIKDDDGASDGGAAYIMFMSDSGYVISYKKITEGISGFNVQVYNFDYMGASLSGGSDFDQDGVNDLLLGGRLTDDGGTDRGAVYMLLLNTDGSVKSHKVISSTSNKLTGLIEDIDYFGSSIATVDYNTQNNTAKISFGTYYDDDGGANAGAAYVVTIDLMSTYDPSPNAGRIHRSSADLNRNWSYGESFDENGNIIGASKQYVDELGRNTQRLTLNIDKNRVLIAQTIYDKYGRPVVNTLPAPTGLNMVYKDSFVTDVSGNIYAYQDFDGSHTLNDPDSVGSNFPNTLGDYYSDNGEDDYLATSAFPYSRVEYMADPTGRVKRSAAPGENFKMGSGHESRVFYMFTGGELDRAFGLDSSFYCQTSSTDRLESRALSNTEIVADKTISVDAEGKIAITFKSDGLTIASCVSGMTPTDSVPEQRVSNTMLFAGTQSVDIHLPKARSTTLKFPLPSYWNGETWVVVLKEDMSHELMDLENSGILTTYTLDSTNRRVTFTGTNRHRFLRISYAYSQSILDYWETNSITPPDAKVEYTLDYSHFTANYYDLSGRLRMNISPKGFDYTVNGKHDEFSKYDYDPYGQLIAKETPDEGLMEYLYSDEGAVRFSQNAQQSVDSKFSYVRYDDYNRSIESGEYDESGANYIFKNYYDTTGVTNVQVVLDDVDFDFNDTYCSDQNYVAYDLLVSSDEIPSAYTYKNQYPQHNLKARVSRTWNNNNQTWYSYDYAGRPEYTVQELIDTDFSSTKDSTVKTVEYTYAPLTSVLEKEVFQKNHSAEKLTHEFTYNDNLQLLTATAKDNINNTVGEAAFEYYINGQLKRKEIGGELQGMDYVYTLHGQLKSINHPSLYDAYDPGEDGKTGSANSPFEADVFGMALDYYEDDYIRTGSNIISSVTTAADGYNNGLIKATRWRIKDENLITRDSTDADVTLYTEASIDKEMMYNYVYDDFYRFETATFGVFDNDTSSSAFSSRTDFKVFGTSANEGVDYDIIGNITDLNRNAYAGVRGLLMDSLIYSYSSGKSQLASIKDNSSSTYTTDFKTTGTDNFTYNSLGQMTASDADDVSTITYYPNGQVKKVTFNSTENTAEYFYNERNIKIKSKFTDVVSNPNVVKYNWYITDASGALKSVHERTDAGSVSLTNQAIYGGGRLGMYDKNTSELNYEITDNLGNVRLTIRDSSTSGTAKVEVLSWADYYPFGEVLLGRNSDPTGMFGYQGQERVSNSTNQVSGSRWYNFNLRMYNPSLGRFNTIDPYSQFNSPYLAMANNPISFVDPDGGKAILTEGQKTRIYNRLMLRPGFLMSRRDWLSIWLQMTGTNSYKGMSLEGLDAAVRQSGLDGYNLHLSGLGGNFIDGLYQNLNHPAPGENPSESSGKGGFIIDGLQVSGRGYELFIANTLRQDITDISTNQVTFVQNSNGNWEPMTNFYLQSFGEGMTNWERSRGLAQEARDKNDNQRAAYKKDWKDYKKKYKPSPWIDDNGSIRIPIGMLNRFRAGIKHALGVKEWRNTKNYFLNLEYGKNMDVPIWLKGAGGNSGGVGTFGPTSHTTKGIALIIHWNSGGAQTSVQGLSNVLTGFGVNVNRQRSFNVNVISPMGGSFYYKVYDIKTAKLWNPLYFRFRFSRHIIYRDL